MSSLRKEITLLKGIVLAVSMIIGSGLLGLPGLALELGTPQEALGGWICIALAMIPMLYIFMNLGMRYSTAAGLARYAQEAVGGWGGYAVTYLMCGSVLLGMPALASIIAAYVAKFLGLPESCSLLLSVGCIALMVGSNLLGIRATSWVNGLAFVTLLGLFGIMVGENLPYLERGFAALQEFGSEGVSLHPKNLWSICALLFWAYIGWENLSFGLEEFQEPRKNIPRVYWGSFLLVTLLYLILAFTSVGAELSGYPLKGPEG
ncbi:MAG TPA: amino acid permease, partial [Synergistaceae bacterium]|nr:amino acid permease [Synergistaceae bacterium]